MDATNVIKVMSYEGVEDFITKQRRLLDIEQEEEKALINKLLNEVVAKDLITLGYVVYNLRVKRIKTNFSGKWIIVLEYKEPTLPQNLKIGVGDQVGLYDWMKVQNEGCFGQHKFEATGVIERIQGQKIRLMIDNKQTYFKKANDDEDSEQMSKNKNYCMVIQDNVVTYKRNIKALQQIKAQDGQNELLNFMFPQRELIPKQPKPYEKTTSTVQSTSYKQLNETQQQAVQMCLNEKKLALIHGPPGTGKTRTLCEFLVQAVNQQRIRILATAPSNIAVDNMIERIAEISPSTSVCRLGHPARVLDSVKNRCVDAQLRGTPSWSVLKGVKVELQKLEKKLDRATRRDEKKELRKDIKAKQKEKQYLEFQAVKDVMDQSQIIFCTNTGAGDRLLKGITFDLVVIDECAQALEISCWIPILKGRKLVVAGDHKQLPPTIKSKLAESEGLGRTLFERIIADITQANTIFLRIQYRMNQKIMDWSSKEVYDGQLQADVSVKEHSIADFNEEVKTDLILLFIDTAGCDMIEAEPITKEANLKQFNKSKYNDGEAALVKVIASELQQLNVQQSDIGIITPYSAQVQCIKNLILETNMEISTVDGFQGREKECIIISMVRSNNRKEVGFLSEYRRMNVAVTRAKRFVCLIGNSETVRQEPFLARLLDYFIEHGELRTAAQYDIVLKINQEVKIPREPREKKPHDKKKGKKDNLSKKKQLEQNDNQFDVKEDHTRHQDFREEQLLSLVQNFVDDSDQELTMEKLNSYERRIVHEICEKYGLQHVTSVGTDALKDIKISKIKKQEELIEVVTNKQEQQQIAQIQSNGRQVSVFSVFQEKNQIESDNEEEKSSEENKIQNQQNQQKKKKKSKPTQTKKDIILDDGFDDLPEVPQMKIALDPKLCSLVINAAQCLRPLNLLSLECRHCKKSFCSNHLLPEDHGCGDIAKVEARQRFVTDNNCDRIEQKEKLQDQFQQKLKEVQSNRNKKQTKKK